VVGFHGRWTELCCASFCGWDLDGSRQAALSDGIVGAWVESAEVTYAAPPQNYQEVPTGTVDGTNTVFTLSYSPIAGTLLVYVNGLLATNYTLAGATITFSAAPTSGASLYATYSF